MGHIRERNLKEGGIRYQAEIRLKGHPTLTAGFDRKTDAKNWIQKVEADIRCGRHQLYSQGKRYTFKEAVDRYRIEYTINNAKNSMVFLMAESLMKQKTIEPGKTTWYCKNGLTFSDLLGAVRRVLREHQFSQIWVSSHKLKKYPLEEDLLETFLGLLEAA